MKNDILAHETFEVRSRKCKAEAVVAVAEDHLLLNPAKILSACDAFEELLQLKTLVLSSLTALICSARGHIRRLALCFAFSTS